jgi:phosphoribosylanthranilate isomerase
MDLDNNPYLPHGLIQVAGVHSLEEAQSLLHAGVDMIGLPLRLPVNEEDLCEAEAARLSRTLPGKCCLITYLDDPEEIRSFADALAVDIVQLHGDVPLERMPLIRRHLPGRCLIKSLVIGKGSIRELEATLSAAAPHVDAFITDTYNPDTGAEGATGLTHDWAISAQLVTASPRPVILAGGLHPGNVTAAIKAVRPHGVDVHTGVENADGLKCAATVAAFVEAARSGFKALH